MPSSAPTQNLAYAAFSIMNLPSWGAQFPHRVEIVAPGRPAGLQTMMHWCIGKAYRVTPASPQPGKPAVWHFAEADDAEAFKAAFSRKR